MGKIIFQIAYEIKPEKRTEFLALAAKLRTELRSLGVTYGIYDVQGHENEFNEVFTCENQEEFDELEDHSNDTVQLLVDKLAKCMNGKMRYTTLREIE